MEKNYLAPELQVLKSMKQLNLINNEKSNLFSIGLISLRVKFESFVKSNKNWNKVEDEIELK